MPMSRNTGRFLQGNTRKVYGKWKQCSNRKLFGFFLTNSDHLLAYSDDFLTFDHFLANFSRETARKSPGEI